MPLSDPANISPIVAEVLRLQPKSVLDLGIGMGVYGAILRQYMDIEKGFIHKDTWASIIAGVEGFAEYRNPVWDSYTLVEVANFSDPEEVIRYKGFDVVMLVDSLEHLDGTTGTWLLDTLLMQNRNVIVSVPVGVHYALQGAVNGNELEVHRHKWEHSDFVVRGGKLIHNAVCAVYSLRGRG